MKMRTGFIKDWWACLKGATSIEYSLIAAGIAVAIAAIVVVLGTDVKTRLFTPVAALFH